MKNRLLSLITVTFLTFSLSLSYSHKSEAGVFTILCKGVTIVVSTCLLRSLYSFWQAVDVMDPISMRQEAARNSLDALHASTGLLRVAKISRIVHGLGSTLANNNEDTYCNLLQMQAARQSLILPRVNCILSIRLINENINLFETFDRLNSLDQIMTPDPISGEYAYTSQDDVLAAHPGTFNAIVQLQDNPIYMRFIQMMDRMNYMQSMPTDRSLYDIDTSEVMPGNRIHGERQELRSGYIYSGMVTVMIAGTVVAVVQIAWQTRREIYMRVYAIDNDNSGQRGLNLNIPFIPSYLADRMLQHYQNRLAQTEQLPMLEAPVDHDIVNQNPFIGQIEWLDRVTNNIALRMTRNLRSRSSQNVNSWVSQSHNIAPRRIGTKNRNLFVETNLNPYYLSVPGNAKQFAALASIFLRAFSHDEVSAVAIGRKKSNNQLAIYLNSDLKKGGIISKARSVYTALGNINNLENLLNRTSPTTLIRLMQVFGHTSRGNTPTFAVYRRNHHVDSFMAINNNIGVYIGTSPSACWDCAIFLRERGKKFYAFHTTSYPGWTHPKTLKVLNKVIKNPTVYKFPKF